MDRDERPIMQRHEHLVHVDGVIHCQDDVTPRQIVVLYRLGDRVRAAAVKLQEALILRRGKG